MRNDDRIEHLTTTTGVCSVIVGGFFAIALGLAAINAHDGQAWAIELLQDRTYLAFMLGGLMVATTVAWACIVAKIVQAFNH